MLSGDEPVEGGADVGRGHRDAPAGPVVAEQHEAELAADGLLVPLQRLPRALPIDPYRLRAQHLVDGGRVAAGETQRGKQAERDGVPVAEALVAGGGLERVRERVP